MRSEDVVPGTTDTVVHRYVYDGMRPAVRETHRYDSYIRADITRFIPIVPGGAGPVLYEDSDDAADVDGCSMLKQVWHIALPLCSPIIGTLGVLRVLGEWNRFVGPLILIRDSHKQMLAVSLLHLEGEYTRRWGELMAGYTIASIPLIILFVFCIRLFIRGLSEGSVKG